MCSSPSAVPLSSLQMLTTLARCVYSRRQRLPNPYSARFVSCKTSPWTSLAGRPRPLGWTASRVASRRRAHGTACTAGTARPCCTCTGKTRTTPSPRGRTCTGTKIPRFEICLALLVQPILAVRIPRVELTRRLHFVTRPAQKNGNFEIRCVLNCAAVLAVHVSVEVARRRGEASDDYCGMGPDAARSHVKP